MDRRHNSTWTDLLITKGVVNTQVSNIPVRVANFTDDQLFMNKGSKLALLEPVTSLEEFKTDNFQCGVLAKLTWMILKTRMNCL